MTWRDRIVALWRRQAAADCALIVVESEETIGRLIVREAENGIIVGSVCAYKSTWKAGSASARGLYEIYPISMDFSEIRPATREDALRIGIHVDPRDLGVLDPE